MVSTITENEELAGTQFTPFNDTKQPQVDKALRLFITTEQGYDTSQIDRFRQGVSMRSPKHVYASVQPKIWAGNLKHTTRVVTLGQARSFVEFDNSITFNEKPEFDPVWFIEDDNYPLPIIFNNGPQQEEEAIVEPFTIPMRKNTNEGPFYPRSVKAVMEDGNNFDNLDGGTTRVEQFIEYNSPLEPRFFLDEGQAYIGAGDYSNLLDETFDPYILYRLSDGIDGTYSDTLNSGKDLIEIGTVETSEGPFPNTIDNPSAPEFFGQVFATTYLRTNSGTDPAIRPGDGDQELTMECFFYVDSGLTGNRNLFSYGDNFTLTLNFNTSPMRPTYQQVPGNVAFIPSSSNVNFGGWNHIAVTREIDVSVNQATVQCWLNGVYLGINNSLAVPNSGTYQLQISNSSFNRFDGRISSFKLVRRVLTDGEVVSEYNRLSQPIYRTDGAIIVPGFQAIVERNLDPFDDTRDERIVDRIQTTDQTFIGELKKLDYDLSEDIRGTFAKKSATAYGDVYGPDAAIYGTDSVAFRGTFKGA